MIALPSLLLLLSCKDPGPAPGGDSGVDPYDVQVGPYDAQVRWTSWGVPHVTAGDYGSLAYGMGYAFARDHACVLADQVLMVNGERSRWFGAAHLDADLGWKGLGVRSQAERGWPSLAPEVQQALVGYAAGYNRWLSEGSLDSRCAGQPWVEPVDHIDLLTYYLALGLYGSGLVFVEAVGSAAPPEVSSAARRAPPPDLSVLDPLLHPRMGSNGWAIGRERTDNGRGMLLSNTHFPAEGERKWHEAHLTIPGQLDVYGASLMGVPVINLGFNAHVAWTHTVSEAPRFTAALLQLDPEDPTRYLYDGQYEAMTSYEVSAEVLQDDGSLETVTRTLWNSRWGPVLNAPVLGWNELYALALSDANADNLAMLGTWFEMNRATSLEEFQAAHRDLGGIPWVHTMATDTEGTAWYIDSSTVPNWSAQAEARYPQWLDEQPLAALFDDYGAPTVDGSDPTFQWVAEAGAWREGVVPYDRMPQLTRTDFVFNANDNHWLSNPSQVLEGYPLLYGDERSPRAPRTRMNARYLAQTGEGSASGADGLFSLDELEAAALDGRAMMAEELRAGVAGACAGLTTVEVDGATVDVAPACAVLSTWDGRGTLDQAGPALWRELLGGGVFEWEDFLDQGDLYATPFDADDPVDTPTGLSADAPVGEALARAVRNLQAAGLTVDQPLSEAQFMRKGAERLPVPGGTFLEGAIAIAEYAAGNATLLEEEEHAAWVNEVTGLTVEGYQVNYGNSFVLAVQFQDDGPQARAILTYSQSDDPTSPHYADQTELYGQARLREVRFLEADVAADVQESVELTLD
ncbi:penicillin acylase family protein [Myxococcota bacterium]|nr:penicillin acylase family protein [Myxococcota bacterium]